MGPVDDEPPEAAAIADDRLARLVREQEELFARLAAGERRVRRVARSVWALQEEERRRFARELHDGIGQLLTALKQELELFAAELPAGPAKRRAEGAAGLASEALADTRHLSRLLRPPILDDLGLEAALRGLVRGLAERGGPAIELRVGGLEHRLPAELETLAFRLVQEALNNVVRHAEAARAEVVVEVEQKHLRLEVSDDGRGLDPRSPHGVGLRSMHDRVELFSGSVRIEARQGGGTRVLARVPLAAEEG
jgi:signal transduction histidine kinase